MVGIEITALDLFFFVGMLQFFFPKNVSPLKS